MPEPLLSLDRIGQVFPTRQGPVRALEDVTFSVDAGQVLCVVGESGSGKTTSAKIAVGLQRPTEGTVSFRGRDVWKLDRSQYRDYRRSVQYVHQDPYASLNPVHSVLSMLAAPLQHHHVTRGRRQTAARVASLLEQVDLTPPENFLTKYPHQLSGGQRQRLSVARALTLGPEVLIADEATSMLDVSIRVSVLNMLKRLREELGVGFLFITHDLAVAKYFGWQGQIAVMYLGRVVESGPTLDVVNNPTHPYTKALVAAVPEPDPDRARMKADTDLREADIPSLHELPSGCPFHPRCPQFEAGLCEVRRPLLIDIGDNRRAACHVVERERVTGRLSGLGEGSRNPSVDTVEEEIP
jgi:peptide/nickel transport system ATP-binding protein